MGSGQLRVLLVDDDEDDCFFFREALGGLDILTKLQILMNGEDLMNFMTTTNEFPHIVFLDFNMPRKNGLQCLAELKRDEKFKTIPVIILSTAFDKNHIEELRVLGALHYIVKPNDFKQLGNEISEVLTLHLNTVNIAD